MLTPAYFTMGQATRKHAVDRDPFSSDLRDITALIQAKKFEPALQRIDKLLEVAKENGKQARLIALIGDLESQRGAYERASEIYEKALKICPRTAYLTQERCYLALIRSKLLTGLSEEAKAISDLMIERFQSAHQEIAAWKNTLEGGFGSSDRVTVSERPSPMNLIYRRTGNLFGAFGQQDLSRDYLVQASKRSSDPQDRLALARSHMASNRTDDANKIAIGLLGEEIGPQSVLAAAGIAIKTAKSDDRPALLARISEHKKGLPKHESDSIVLHEVTALRGQRDPSWKSIATNWLAAGPSGNLKMEATLRRLLLSESVRVAGSPEDTFAQSEALIENREVDPSTWLMAAKQYVVSGPEKNAAIDIERLLVIGCAICGSDNQSKFSHGLGKAAEKIGKKDVAEKLYLRAATLEPQTSQQWSKSAWALGRLYLRNDESEKALPIFETIARSTSVPEQFRILARIYHLDCLGDDLPKEKLAEFEDEFEQISQSSSNIPTLIMLSRRLRGYGGKFVEIGMRCLNRSERITGLSGPKIELNPERMQILRSLSYRYLDYGLYGRIDAVFGKLKKDFESPAFKKNDDFWVFIGNVMSSYTMHEDPSRSGEVFAWVSALPSVSDRGRAIVSSIFGEGLLQAGNRKAAFKEFEVVAASGVRGAPDAARSYYWLSLRSLRSRNYPKAAEFAGTMLQCLPAAGGISTQVEHRNLATAILLIASEKNGNIPRPPSSPTIERAKIRVWNDSCLV